MTLMDNPVALVTGAARGIGAATVDALVSDGWRVVATDACGSGAATSYRQPTEADLRAVVSTHESAAEAHVLDVRDGTAVAAVVSDVVDRHGRLDCLVAAAGIVAGGVPLWEIADEEWAAVLDTDLTGVWHTVRAAAPHILTAPGPGRVVVVASAGGSLGLRHMGAYAAAKHGVIGLVRSLAADLAGTGVTANAVSPGSTRTPILDASAAIYGLDDPSEFVVHQEPLGRLIEPAEVAATIAWLCSDAAAAITGAVVPVDGGMTATN